MKCSGRSAKRWAITRAIGSRLARLSSILGRLGGVSRRRRSQFVRRRWWFGGAIQFPSERFPGFYPWAWPACFRFFHRPFASLASLSYTAAFGETTSRQGQNHGFSSEKFCLTNLE